MSPPLASKPSPYWTVDHSAAAKHLILPNSLRFVPVQLVSTGSLWYSVHIRATPEMMAWRSSTNKKGLCVSIDPGVRTFATCFDPDGLICKWGCPTKTADFGKFWCYLRHLGILYSRINTKRPGSVPYDRLCCVAAQLEDKIDAMLDAMHHRLALWLCNNYETILLPKYEAVARTDITERVFCAAHARFCAYIKEMAAKHQVVVHDCNEAYTTKTCGICGHLSNIGGCDTFTCKNPLCSAVFDRDENAARNILIRHIYNK